MSNGNTDETIKGIIDGGEVPERVSNRLILGVVLDIRKEMLGMEARIGALEEREAKWRNRAVGMSAVITIIWTLATFAVAFLV